MIVETKFTINTIETVNKLKLTDQSMLRLPEAIQLVSIIVWSPFDSNKINDIIESNVEAAINEHETTLIRLFLSILFRKIQKK